MLWPRNESPEDIQVAIGSQRDRPSVQDTDARAGTRRHRQQLQGIPPHEAETRKGGPVDPVDMAFGPSGETVVMLGRRDGFGLVFLYNLVRHRVEAMLQVNDAIQIAAFGKDLWVLEKSGWLHLFENFEEQTRTM